MILCSSMDRSWDLDSEDSCFAGFQEKRIWNLLSTTVPWIHDMFAQNWFSPGPTAQPLKTGLKWFMTIRHKTLNHCRVNVGPKSETVDQPALIQRLVSAVAGLKPSLHPLTAKLFNLNFHPLEVMSRWRDPQLQVSENYSDLTKWRSTVFKYCWLMLHFIFNMFKRWYIMC